MAADGMLRPAPAGPAIDAAIAQAIRPREALTVSQWADRHRILSSKTSPFPGEWRTARNPPLREIMDCMSARSTVREIVAKLPIQDGKSEVAVNAIGYWMAHHPAPILVALPGEVSLDKFVNQKINPLIESTEAVRECISSLASRNAANTRTFKDFVGGQLYLEHAGNPLRLVQSTARIVIADELSKFAAALTAGDDPLAMLRGRYSAFPGSYKFLGIGSPGIRGICRVDELYEASDQRRYHVPCPECSHEHPLEWGNLQWSPDARHAWMVCPECCAQIDEHRKPTLLERGRWIATHPERAHRGYHLNCLYYPLGMGPRWATLAQEFIAAARDPAKLKTFTNERLAEAWEDPGMRTVRQNILADRAEPYALREAPAGVLACTAGVDTQDNRLAVQILGWGRGLACWVLDYLELIGDPQHAEVWLALTDLINRPIAHALGGAIRPEAVAIDAGGHRTEDVYDYVRQRKIRRPMAIFGAVANSAPVLSRGKLIDYTYRGKADRQGVTIHHVGTVRIKHWLYGRLAADGKLPVDEIERRHIHLSDQLDPEFFGGLVAEVYNPARNRFEKRKGAPRNEPLDTWGYAYAAAHHPELRLHRLSAAEWDAREQRLRAAGTPQPRGLAAHETPPPPRDALARPPRRGRGTRHKGL